LKYRYLTEVFYTSYVLTDATTTKPTHLRAGVSDFQAYIAPMAIFMGITLLGDAWKSLYPWSYLLKTLMVPAAMWFLWPRYTPIRWNHWWLGIVVGIIGIFQWVGMQLYLQQFEFFKPSPDAFDPFEHFQGQDEVRWVFIGVRVAGAVLVVPLMEELFWRDFLWRSILSPNFKKITIGSWAWKPFLGVAVAFSLVHGNWWLTSIVWGLMIGVLLSRREVWGPASSPTTRRTCFWRHTSSPPASGFFW